MFNEVDGPYDDVAINTFKAGLPSEHGLRKSLTSKPVTNVRQLMDQINKYRRVEEDHIQGRGKAKVIPQETRDFSTTGSGKDKKRVVLQMAHKMAGDPAKRNPSLYCQYHQDHGHITEDCRNLWDHLDQLVREGRLTPLLHHSSGRGSQAGSTYQGDAFSGPPLGTINVIFAAPGRTRSYSSRVMSVSHCMDEGSSLMSKKVKTSTPLVLRFSDEDKAGTIQPHDDTLVVALKIGGYDVRRVMVDE
nr:uncharacterized protein LOC112024493 [Quercus suber]